MTVVDNDSSLSQQEMLADAAGSSFSLIQLPTNVGFGKAANNALLDGDGEFVVVSNADISPEPEALRALVAAAVEHPDAGMIGPVFGDGTDNYHDHLPGAFTLLVRTLIGSFGRASIEMPVPGAVRRVEQPSGACFLMRRTLWVRCGGFDPDFFLWYEDVDLASRLHQQGRDGLVVGAAGASHLGGESFAKLDERRKQKIRLVSLGLYMKKHHPRASILAVPLLWLANHRRIYGLCHFASR